MIRLNCHCSDHFTFRLLQLKSSQAYQQNKIAWLKRVQNKAARLIMKRKREHVTPLLKELHRLPVKFLCQYKVAVFTYHQFEGFNYHLTPQLTFVPTKHLVPFFALI